MKKFICAECEKHETLYSPASEGIMMARVLVEYFKVDQHGDEFVISSPTPKSTVIKDEYFVCDNFEHHRITDPYLIEKLEALKEN